MAPVCIGSHYAVRTRALREIGGIGPELAEDFSTSFLLTSAGWHGAFAHRAEAHGEGPLTLAAMVKQEFQWSRSLVTVLLDTVPHHIGRMPWWLRLRFLFVLFYYPMMSMITCIGVLLPACAAVTGHAWLNLNYLQFLVHWLSMTLCVFAVHLTLRYRGLLRPKDPPLLSWQTWLYVLVRWPYILRGSLAAVRQKISPKQVRFAVTPKTRDGLERLSVATVTPYLLLSLLTSVCALYGEFRTPAVGYVFLCILASTSYTVVSLAVCLLHTRENQTTAGSFWFTARQTVAAPLSLAAGLLIPLLLSAVLYPSYVVEVLHW
jgi:cellulose synthase (UDP-forming)